MKKKWSCLGCFFLLVIFCTILGYLPSLFLASYTTSPRGGVESTGKLIIGTANRGQLNYYIENNKVASSLEELGISLGGENKYYQLVFEATEEAVYSYVIPRKYIQLKLVHPIDLLTVTLKIKNKEAKAFIGIVAFNKDNDNLLTGICISEKPSLNKPPIPLVKDGRIVCAPGTIAAEY